MLRRLREQAVAPCGPWEPPDLEPPEEDNIYESLRDLWQPETSPPSSTRTEVMRSGDEGSADEGEDEGEEDKENVDPAVFFVAQPVGASTPREASLDRGRRPSTRRSRRTSSLGGSPLSGGLPYTGRPICKCN